MVITGLTTQDLYNTEPLLKDFLPRGLADCSTYIDEALYRISTELQSMGKEVRNYCKPFQVLPEDEYSAPYIGESTERDEYERMLAVFNSGNVVEGVAILEGSNDGYSFQKVISAELNGNIEVREFGETFLYYRVRIVGTGTVVLRVYLVPSSFYFAHKHLTIANIARSVIKNTGDAFDRKYMLYQEKYQNDMNNLRLILEKPDDTTYYVENSIKKALR